MQQQLPQMRTRSRRNTFIEQGFYGQSPTETVTPLAADHQLRSEYSSCNVEVDPINVPSNQNQSHMSCSEPTDSTSGGGNKRRRGRGPTLMRDVWERPKEERTPVSFNRLGQPNDKNTTSILANFLGTLARNGNHAPLHFLKWAKMPESYKKNMLKIVKLKFEIPEGGDDFIVKSLSNKWRSWKSSLRKLHFDPTKSVEEHLSKVPARVEKDQWKELVLYWSSQKGMDASIRNKVNRKRQKSNHHRTGTRSFAVIKEIEQVKLGYQATRDDLLMNSSAKLNLTPANEVTGEAIEKSKEPLSDDIQVMGEHGLDLSESRGAPYSLAMEYKAAFENMQKQYGELNKKLEEVQTASLNHQNHSFASISGFRPIQVASSGKDKQYWAKEHLKIFCRLCLEQSSEFHCLGTHFDEELWRNISEQLTKQTGENYYDLAEVKSKWNNLKEEWQKWKQLIDGESNLSWDPQKNTVDASEEWWKRKIRMNPEFRTFRAEGIPPDLETLLDSMFMNIQTRPQYSPSNLNDDDMHSSDGNIDEIVAELSSKSKRVVPEPIHSSNTMMNTKNTKKKKLREADKGKRVVNRSHDLPSMEASYADFVEMLEGIAEVEQNYKLHFFALDHLKEKMNQIIFKSFKSDEKRVNWLKYEFKKHKSM